jgi:hypothetical protein
LRTISPACPGTGFLSYGARASEFYADQPVVRSYLALYWRFVMDPTLSIGSRMVRPSRGGWR